MSDPLDTDDGGCDWRYLPPSCTEPLYAHYMPLWYLLIFGMVGVHGSLVVVSALGTCGWTSLDSALASLKGELGSVHLAANSAVDGGALKSPGSACCSLLPAFPAVRHRSLACVATVGDVINDTVVAWVVALSTDVSGGVFRSAWTACVTCCTCRVSPDPTSLSPAIALWRVLAVWPLC